MGSVRGFDADLSSTDHGNPVMHRTTSLWMHRMPVRFGHFEHYFGLELPVDPPDVCSTAFLGPLNGTESSTNVSPRSGASAG